MRAEVLFLWALALLSASLVQGSTPEEGVAEAPVVQGRLRLEAITSPPSSIKVVLDGDRVAYLGSDGHFSFLDVPPGPHLLEVVALGFYFQPLRIDVSHKDGELHASWVENRRREVSFPLVIAPYTLVDYYERKEPFSALGMLKNPMVIMILFSVFAIFILPKMTEGIDPEEMKQMQENMANQPTLTDLLQGRTTPSK